MSRLTREEIARAWDGIPASYWPSADRPWRVSWGFGRHEDFETRADAVAGRAAILRRQTGGGWETLVAREPFDVHERTREMLRSAA